MSKAASEITPNPWDAKDLPVVKIGEMQVAGDPWCSRVYDEIREGSITPTTFVERVYEGDPVTRVATADGASGTPPPLIFKETYTAPEYSGRVVYVTRFGINLLSPALAKTATQAGAAETKSMSGGETPASGGAEGGVTLSGERISNNSDSFSVATSRSGTLKTASQLSNKSQPAEEQERALLEIVHTAHHDAEKEVLQSAITHLLTANMRVVVCDVLERSNGQIQFQTSGANNTKTPTTHSVLLYKNPPSSADREWVEIVVIDPNNARSSNHIASNDIAGICGGHNFDLKENLIKVFCAPETLPPYKIISFNSKSPRIYELDKKRSYRDCVDMAVKLGSGFLHYECDFPAPRFTKLTEITSHQVVKLLSNTNSIDSAVPPSLAGDKSKFYMPVRVKQSSDWAVVNAFNKAFTTFSKILLEGNVDNDFMTEFEAYITNPNTVLADIRDAVTIIGAQEGGQND